MQAKSVIPGENKKDSVTFNHIWGIKAINAKIDVSLVLFVANK